MCIRDSSNTGSRHYAQHYAARRSRQTPVADVYTDGSSGASPSIPQESEIDSPMTKEEYGGGDLGLMYDDEDRIALRVRHSRGKRERKRPTRTRGQLPEF